MDYQKIVIVGNVTADPKRQKSKKSGAAYALFQVALEGKLVCPVAAFGKVGESVVKYVGKGRQVLVEGRVTLSEKGRFGVVADRVVFGASPKQ